MKYPVFFLLLAGYFAYLVASLDSPYRFFLLWPLMSALVLAAAYWTNQPYLVAGKSEQGRFLLRLALLNLPWLLFTWLTFALQLLLSRESAVNRIGDTNFYIGRYPLGLPGPHDYAIVIDLTCEFPRSPMGDCVYVCHPNLDGVALRNIALPVAITADEKVFLHCAQGHGRSATYAAILIGSTPAYGPPPKALALIQQSRPKAIPSAAQRQQIEAHAVMRRNG